MQKGTGWRSVRKEGIMNSPTKHTILIVDDESSMIESYHVLLEDKFTLLDARSGKEALSLAREHAIDLVLLDIRMPDMDGIEALKKLKESNDAEVIMVSAVKTMRTAIQAVQLGAYDYIAKPFEIDDLLATIGKALEKRGLAREVCYLRSELGPCMFDNIIGTSAPIKRVFAVISEVAKNQSTVLITGESGTGKELIARAVHCGDQYKDTPFVALDCATIPANLVESELFGHEKGSFTDATCQKPGKFELAGNGTLFLDEVGNLPMETQSKLLRALEEREIQRVGGTKTIPVAARIISATNIDLKKATREGTFRHDLYYRLNVIPIEVPPLRERREDIPLLIEHFIQTYNKEFNKSIKGISKDAVNLFMNYSWPGNVRELRNVIERLVALSREEVISHKRLPLDILLADKEHPKNFFDAVSLKDARLKKRTGTRPEQPSSWACTAMRFSIRYIFSVSSPL